MALGKASKKLRALVQPRASALPSVTELLTLDKSADRRAKERRLEDDALFRTLVDTAPIPMWISGPDKDGIYFNRAWLEYTGCTRTHESGHGWAPGIHPDDRERCWAIYIGAFEARSRVSMEYRVRRADGRYGWMLDTGAPRYTDGGEFIGYIGSCIDITERKEAEVARATLEQALSQGMEGLALMDELGAFVYMNRTYAEMYGFTVSDLMGKTWKELYDPDQIAVMEPHISVVLNTYAPWRGELVGRKKTGRYFYVEVSLQRLKDVQYADASLACGCRDITERKWAEAALRESEERYALALRGSNDGHWDWSIDTNYCYLSPRWKELLGFDDHEIADHNDSFFERLHPDDLPRVRAAVQAHVIHRAPYNVEVRLRHKTGGYRWFRSRGQAMWNANGQAIRMAGVLTDITEHKQAQEALRTAHDDLEARVQIRTAELTAANAALAQQIAERQRAEEALLKSHSLFRTVAAVSPVGIYRTDPAGSCVYANERCSEMTGLAQEDMHGEGWAHALHPDDRARIRETWHRAVCRAAPFRDEYRFQRADGTVTWVLGQATAELGETGEVIGFVGTITDISSRKEAEDTLTRLNETLQKRADELTDVNQELEAFSYSVSHDLRTPLRHIEGFADLLRGHTEAELDEQGRRFLTMISASSKRMGVLIDDLLAFSKVGRAELRTATVALNGLVQEVVRDLQPDVKERRIRWDVHPLPEVVADAAMLRLVFANLIGNAVKYTRDRHTAMIEIGQEVGRPDEVVVFIRDNGVGFDAQYAHKLFGVFQRLHTTDAFEGHGIGLANVRRIIHRHGGRTWAEGQIDAGATFWLSLPIPKLPHTPPAGTTERMR